MKPSGIWKSREMDVAPEIRPTLGFDLAAAVQQRQIFIFLIGNLVTDLTLIGNLVTDLTGDRKNRGTVADAPISTNSG